MSIVTLENARENLPELVSAAARGEEVIIERDGVPAVRLVPVPAETEKETPGQRFMKGFGKWDGQFEFPSWEEWKQMDAEIEADFEESINKSDPRYSTRMS